MRLPYRILLAAICFPLFAHAQIGEHRNTLSIGGNAGYNMTTVRFTPKVPQGMKGGMNMGFTARYTVEKYFATIASIQAEVNFSQLGWKEDIRDMSNQPVINTVTKQAESMSAQSTMCRYHSSLTSPGEGKTMD